MSELSFTIMPAKMRALARYEETFFVNMQESDFDDIKLLFPEKYRMTLDDLSAAIRNIMARDPTVGDLMEYWYYPLTTLEDKFGITEACGWKYYEEDEENDMNSMSDDDAEPEYLYGLPLREEDVFSSVWDDFDDLWTENEDKHISEVGYFEDFLDEIETFYENKDKPIAERDFTDKQKKNFIGYYGDGEALESASEFVLELCRKFTDELCEKDSGRALHLKGYACYGGNRLYACDWKTSRDCMIRLFEKKGDPSYANTLGYIYYYGRCTGGVPEYEKAFKMFTIAAANGLHEGMYKLADMFRHGYACQKSLRTARFLYGLVYDDCYRQFLDGHNGNFADAALRMGNVFLKGIGEDVMPEQAYRYYMEADFASKMRVKDSDFFGDTTVAIAIQKALDETKAKLPEDFFKDYLSIENPLIFRGLTDDGYRVGLSFARSGDGDAIIKLRRIAKRAEQKAQPIFVTYPAINFCNLITGIEMTSIDIKTSFDLDAEKPVKYDSCEWNSVENRIDFYYDEDMVGWISCEEYRIYGKNKGTPEGKLLAFVSVEYKPGGRTYDYLCDIPDVVVGDKVIVMGYDGETEVAVKTVYTKYESELGIPIDKYKKILRKA